MFKLQKDLQSMDFNKNMEKYKFNPSYTISTSKKRETKIKDFNQNYANFGENTLNNSKKFPPIYFYRKVSNPYKYNIASVPKYLIKSNEEKRFIDKLYKSLTNEKDKNTLKDLLDKNKKKIHFKKDHFKPKYIDVQKLLKYRPGLYEHASDPLERNKLYLNKKNINTFEEKNENIYNNDNMTVNVNPCQNNENANNIIDDDNILNNENKIKIEEKEISKEDQIKYRYQLSDIFNKRKEPVFLNKSAEKYLFKKNLSNLNGSLSNTCPNISYTNNNYNAGDNKFYTSSESKSDWIPNKINNKKMGTNSSVSYNILCPMYSNTNRFLTATELNKNNLYNESPAFRRVKSISEFIDLTRVFATNTLGCFDRKTKIPNFRINNNIGTTQLDEYHINRNLIAKPI